MKNRLLDPDKIHDWLKSICQYNKNPFLLVGINDDDCAILKIGENRIIITTDYLNSSPISMELGISKNWDLGRLLVAVNISDLCGTGAKPIAMLTSLMFEKGSSEDSFKDFIRGIKFELDKYNIPLVGGDTKLGKHNSYCGIAIGLSTPKMRLFTKNGASSGDLIWLSGEVGSVSAAVLGLSEKNMSKKWEKWAKCALVEPNLPIDKSLKVSRNKIGNGGTDLSDGLGENLYDLCESSNVGATIYTSKLPINSNCTKLARKMKIPEWAFAFNIGGDFQFIVTGRKKYSSLYEKFGFFCIGEITKSKDKLLVLNSNKQVTLPRNGHSDFNISNFADEVGDILIKTNQLN